jgi:hypothetical protein
VISKISCEKFDTVSAMILRKNQWQRQLESFKRTKVEVQSRVPSGLRVMGYSCSEARFMSPKTEISGIELWSNITIHTLLDMQATLRPLKWYLNIIGGHKCLNTLASISRHASCGIKQSYNTCKGNLTDLRRILHLSLAKGNPK